jgi:hypothetical protein
MGNEQSSTEDEYKYNDERFKQNMRKYIDPYFGYNQSKTAWEQTLNNYMELTIALSLKEYEKKKLDCCIKFKEKFMKWLWKAREKISMRRFHPFKIVELLEKGVEIDELINLL